MARRALPSTWSAPTVVILPDNDAPGREHADDVARSLAGKAARIRVVDLPGLPDKGDVSDWFAAGGTVEAFNDLVEAAADWSDDGTQPPDDDAATERPHPSRHRIRRPEHEPAARSGSCIICSPSARSRSGTASRAAASRSASRTCGLHVAAGRIWHGRQVKQCAVLYVALERAGVVARRAIAWGLEHDLSQAQLPFKVIRGPLDFRDPQIAADIVATVEDLAQRHGCEAGLVIVDTVSPRPVRRRREQPEGHGRCWSPTSAASRPRSASTSR